MVRKSDDWVASSSTTQNFLGNQAEAKCETFYNRAVSQELGKFEKEYVPLPGSPVAGPATLVVVSLLCALRGDKTNFGNVGGDRAATTKALQVSWSCICLGFQNPFQLVYVEILRFTGLWKLRRLMFGCMLFYFHFYTSCAFRCWRATCRRSAASSWWPPKCSGRPRTTTKS